MDLFFTCIEEYLTTWPFSDLVCSSSRICESLYIDRTKLNEIPGQLGSGPLFSQRPVAGMKSSAPLQFSIESLLVGVPEHR